MTTVICKICEHTVPIDTCWCVIDAREKTRYYECKKLCIVQRPPSPAPAPAPAPPPIDEEEIRPAAAVEEWAPSYPSQTLFYQIVNWFSAPSGYTKVKTS